MREPATISRRGLVRAAGAAIGATAAGVAVPALAETVISASDPDVRLLDLIRRYAEAEEEAGRLSEASDEAWRAALDAYPPRPEALRWQPGDFPRTGFGRGVADRDESGAPTHYTKRAAVWLRDHEPFPAWARRTGAAMSAAETEASEARRLEILAAWDVCVAERRAVDDRVGYRALVETEDAAADLVVTLAREIKRARPATMAGLRALAEWVGRQAVTGAAHDDLLSLFAGTVAGFGGEAS